MRLPSDRTHRTLAGLALAGALVLLAPAAAVGLETDQYLTWGQTLEDSAGPVNEFVNARFAAALARVNRGAPERLACEDLPLRLYRSLFQSTLRRFVCPWCSSRIRRFMESDPAVDRFPPAEVSRGRYKHMSVYRDPAFPFILPLASTVRVGDVYFGADKPGHLFGFGGRYYQRYRKARRRGAEPEEAMRRAVRWGLTLERSLVGGIVDGIFSHGDLEANFQGLLLARDLCEADPPHLVLGESGWRLARPVDMRRYITPFLDESYNNSHFSRQRWRHIRRILETEYCPLYGTAELQGRWERYARWPQSNLSREMIAAHFAARGKDRQRRHSVEAICPLTPSGATTTELPAGAEPEDQAIGRQRR